MSLSPLTPQFPFYIIYVPLGVGGAAPVAYGSSQARGQIRAAAAGIAMQDLGLISTYTVALQQCQILNPLSEVRD